VLYSTFRPLIAFLRLLNPFDEQSILIVPTRIKRHALGIVHICITQNTAHCRSPGRRMNASYPIVPSTLSIQLLDVTNAGASSGFAEAHEESSSTKCLGSRFSRLVSPLLRHGPFVFLYVASIVRDQSFLTIRQLLLGALAIGPWLLLIVYDAILYIFRAATYDIPYIGGRARNRPRPRAPSLSERPSGRSRTFSLTANAEEVVEGPVDGLRSRRNVTVAE
jgi:hypothetical protein